MRDIALWVDDAESAYRETTKRGARGVREPSRCATIRRRSAHFRRSPLTATRIHAFVERKNYRGVFLPGFRAVEGHDPIARPTGLQYIDHMVGNVGWGQMNAWVDFYRDVMGFQLYQHFDDKDISTEYSALMSKVMSNGNGRVKFPDQRAGRGQQEIADRRVSGVLQRPRRAAYRHGHRRHHRDGVEAARSGRRFSARAEHLLSTI